MAKYVIASFYKFVHLNDCELLQWRLLAYCQELGVCGSILLATEGINATIAGSRVDIDSVLAYLRADPRFTDMGHKETFADAAPFARMKVRLKQEIVNLGLQDVNPNDGVGTYVAASDWNKLISEPDVVLIDVRNDFEYRVGSFRGAVNPRTGAFNQFPQFVQDNLDPGKHKKIAMFCTGGIRCEKATTYLLQQGFSEVYHLKDGILKYLEQVPAQESLWEGACFVFDERVAVSHDLETAVCELCPVCQTLVCGDMRLSPNYRHGVCCPNCYHTLTPERLARLTEKQRQKELAQQRAETAS